MEASPHERAAALPEPTTVGIRELRHDFRAWIERARTGERIVVTDRGRPVAELGPHVGGQTWLQGMYERGEVIQARVSLAELPAFRAGTPVTTRGSDALQELREDRI